MVITCLHVTIDMWIEVKYPLIAKDIKMKNSSSYIIRKKNKE